jgi:hypothetical protein
LSRRPHPVAIRHSTRVGPGQRRSSSRVRRARRKGRQVTHATVAEMPEAGVTGPPICGRLLYQRDAFRG